MALARILRILEQFTYLIKTKASIYVLTKFLFCAYSNKHIRAHHQRNSSQFKSKMTKLKLSTDWFSSNVPFWFSVFDDYNFSSLKEVKALEIGSWEGLSSFFILNNLQNSNLTCVDTWLGSEEHKDSNTTNLPLNDIEFHFDYNLSDYKNRLTKYKGTSLSFFGSSQHESYFDFIYIDGSHFSDDLLIDAIKCFDLLKVGGIMVFDDYFWRHHPEDRHNPAFAINTFLKYKAMSLKIVRFYYQIIIQKI
ncbi:Methyltransferase domain containing protein [Candidatus Methylopumilus planktonicus]|uniref:class I SAM-dependent methyltransferase n=1 Tax=Candidatus Methylopumilus planktonicus TaxID=1581557 RepID=UPI003BEF1D21